MKKSLILLMIGLMLVAGCSSVTAGKAVPAAADLSEAAKPISGQSVLGDLSTIDYCGLISPSLISAAGAAPVGNPRPSFASCSLDLTVQNRAVAIEVGFVDLPTTGSRADRIKDDSQVLLHGLSVQRRKDAAGCQQYLVFADGVSIRAGITGAAARGIPADALCGLTKAAIAGIASVAVEQRVNHVQYPENSLGRVATCELYSVDQAATELGRPALTVAEYPSKHECQWGEAQSSLYVSVFVKLSKAPQAINGITEEMLGNRTSFVTSGQQFCVISTVQAPSPLADNGDSEIAAINVSVADTGKDACTVARAAATVVWPKLPPLA